MHPRMAINIIISWLGRLRQLDRGGREPFERLNVERPIFRNFEIPNIERTKDELFDFFPHICLNYLNIKEILIVLQIAKF